MKVIVFYCLALIFIPLQLSAQGSDYKFQSLSIKDGLSQVSVICILQDSKGYIWFGTADGLNKYDGYNFTVYRYNPLDSNSLSDSHIRSLYEDKEGYIWIGTGNGELNKYDKNTNKFKRYKPKTIDTSFVNVGWVRTLLEDKYGTFWVGTHGGGLFIFDKKLGTFKQFLLPKTKLNNGIANYIMKIKEDNFGNIWFCTSNGAYRLKYTNNKDTNIFILQNNPEKFNSLSLLSVYTVDITNENNCYFGTYGGGLNFYDHKQDKTTIYKYNPNDINSISNDKVTAIIDDRLGNIWIGTFGGGLCRLDLATNKIFRYQHNINDQYSICSDYIFDLYIDKSGILWIGTYTNGISKIDIRRKGFKYYSSREKDKTSLVGNSVNAILEDSNGILWIATADGGLNRYDKKQKSFSCEGSFNTIATIIEDSNKNLWIGTFYGGLFKFDAQKNKIIKNYKTIYLDGKLIQMPSITSILEVSKNEIYIGTRRGLLIFNPINETFSRFNFKNYKVHNTNYVQINGILKDNKEIIWFATEEGVDKFDKFNNTMINFNITKNKGELLSNTINVIYQDSQGRIWFGTDYGLTKCEQNSKSTNILSTLTMQNGLSSNVINAIQEDNHANIWVSTNRGISKINPSINLIRNYSVEDGLLNYEYLGASFKSKTNNNLYFGCRSGFNEYNPDSISENPYVPGVIITNFYLFNKLVTPGNESVLKFAVENTNEINLSYKDYSFSIEFSAMYYPNPEKVKYSYIMEGFDNDWNYTNGTQHIVHYSNLSPGKYFFKVKASNSYGTWNSSPKVLTIIIKPPFWQTWTFRISLLILIILSIYIYIRLRIYNYKKSQIILQKLVDERTKTISEQNKEIIIKNKELEIQKEEILAQRDNLEELNVELGAQRDEIVRQHNELEVRQINLQQLYKILEQKNKDITDSIVYAEKIQKALLPTEANMRQAFTDYFVLYIPKDIVSGDFYWTYNLQANQNKNSYQNDNIFLFAVVDCTGHGVPGAFMSIIANNYLNQAVIENNLTEPIEIIEYLNNQIINSLHYSIKRESIKDGFEIGICSINKHLKTLKYAGTNIPLIFIQNSSLNLYKTYIPTIGCIENFDKFINEQISLNYYEGDLLYMATDGYTDQFDSEGKVKFSNQRLRDTLLSIQKQPLLEQQKLLKRKFIDWKGNSNQIDDILLLGAKL